MYKIPKAMHGITQINDLKPNNIFLFLIIYINDKAAIDILTSAIAISEHTQEADTVKNTINQFLNVSLLSNISSILYSY